MKSLKSFENNSLKFEMYASVRREIPEFLNDHLVYCDNLMQQQQKSCLLLTRNMKFCEFQRKQLLNSIDLHETVLAQVSQRLKNYKGPRGKWYENSSNCSQLENVSSVMESTIDEPSIVGSTREICFGKYIYRYLDEVAKLYLLIRCWDKLVVLHKCAAGFIVSAEYEQVASFKIVHDRVKYQATVELQFECGRTLRTDFNDTTLLEKRNDRTESNRKEFSNKKLRFKQLLERVGSAQTELQVHKTETQKAFERLRNSNNFGPNFIRSLNMEEKQMLARCGDIWVRLTPHNDAIVLGVPLFNNCTSPNLTTIKQLKPLLKMENELVTGISCEHRLYQLQQHFEHIDLLETFFQSEDVQLQSNSWIATKISQQQLLPESFAVLLITFKVSQIISLSCCPLFVEFVVEKDLQLGTEPKIEQFCQQMFLKNIDFHNILSQSLSYEISFKPATLQQDFLTIAMTSFETKLFIKFTSAEDLATFELLLVNKYDFEIVKRVETIDIGMEVDEAKETESTTFTDGLFYNRKPTSLWHGILILRAVTVGNGDNLNICWKFYTKNEQNACLFLKLLFNELLLYSCNIDKLDCPRDFNVKLLEFENAMRRELNLQIMLINSKTNKKQKQTIVAELSRLQLETDLIAVTDID